MKSDRFSQTVIRKLGILYILFTLLLTSLPAGAFADTLTVDVKANGQDSLALTSTSTPFTVTVSSTGATACQMTSPAASGISTSASMSIPFGHSYYPAVGGSTTFTVSCTDGVTSVTDSAVVSLSLDSGNTGGTGNNAVPTIDVKANGSDGPLTLGPSDTYTYTWSSTNTTACEQSSPAADPSGISTSGTSAAIGAGHPFFPTAGHPVTITITCTNGTSNAVDSVVIGLSDSSGTGTTTPPTVDIKANGSDGPLSINSGDTYTYSWSSANATACEQTSPIPDTSGISTSGQSAAIASGHPFFPTAGNPVTITIVCTNGTSNAVDSVVIGLATNGGTTTPTVDVKANGSDGPVTLVNGAPYTYTWTSSNATACEQTSPAAANNSGISTSGQSASIAPGHPYYPAVGGSTTITVTCTNGTANATDSVVINAINNGGGCTAPVITSAATAGIAFGQPFSFTFTATSANGTTTFAVDPSTLPPGLSFATSTATISGSLTQTGNFTIAVTATNDCGNTPGTLSVGTGSSGGGGGSSGGGGGSVPILGTGGYHAPIPGGACLLLHDYMRMDFQNDPDQVTKLQTFLHDVMGNTSVTINGTFDQATFSAVAAFQVQYKDDILTPWGLTAPTGYVYILTLKKINEIWCHVLYPLNDAQQQEIIAYRALIAKYGTDGLPANYSIGGYVRHTVTETVRVPILNEGSTTTTLIPVVGVSTTTIYKGQNATSTAAAIFAFPGTWLGFFQCLYELLLILVVLYILGSILKDVLYADVPENVLKRFMTKWLTMVVGLIVAIIVAWILKEWCLILPLIIALILALVWMLMYPKHTATKKQNILMVNPGETQTIETKDGNTVIVVPPTTTEERK